MGRNAEATTEMAIADMGWIGMILTMGWRWRRDSDDGDDGDDSVIDNEGQQKKIDSQKDSSMLMTTKKKVEGCEDSDDVDEDVHRRHVIQPGVRRPQLDSDTSVMTEQRTDDENKKGKIHQVSTQSNTVQKLKC
jgi:hypothetical protein